MDSEQQKHLARIVDTFSDRDGIHSTNIEGVNCIKLSEQNARLPSVYVPSLCVIAQGQKQVFLENESYLYQPSKYLVVSVNLPVIGEVTQCSKDKPYLCFQVELDPHQIAELIIQAQLPAKKMSATCRGIFIGDMDLTLSDAVLRLARLLEEPHDICLLAPMIKREIYYRLLTGPYGNVISQLAQPDSHLQRITTAIGQLKLHYQQPIRVEELAHRVGMSLSSFHTHFKNVTAMSPLQYQKRIRLLEARQIMLLERQDATSTAYRVGYESPSQFNREYSRLFGQPPLRDIKQLREMSSVI